uniref:Putative conserved plasma membrane protein n=1 Tax=Rhipicephalus microplus TaxID=6941 RepID=A0A6G5A2S4_RHIMP
MCVCVYSGMFRFKEVLRSIPHQAGIICLSLFVEDAWPTICAVKMLTLKISTLSLFALTLVFICGYHVTTAFPHKWSSQVVCYRNPCSTSDDCPPGCRCIYHRGPGPEAKKGPAQSVCSA